MRSFVNSLCLTFTLLCLNSCSLFGIQNEKGPEYKVIKKDGAFEIRSYQPYIVAQTTVKGDYDNASEKAFKILAGYIFGDNQGEKKISMTSPVEVKNESVKIDMTSPVTINQDGKSYTMRFSMPQKYTLASLPKPNDDRIEFKKVGSKLVAAHRYSWFSSKKRNRKKADELKSWLSNETSYQGTNQYTYAGYNPPWTLPFLRRNEVMIEVSKE